MDFGPNKTPTEVIRGGAFGDFYGFSWTKIHGKNLIS